MGSTWGFFYNKTTVKQNSHVHSFTQSKTYILKCNTLIDFLLEQNLSFMLHGKFPPEVSGKKESLAFQYRLNRVKNTE